MRKKYRRTGTVILSIFIVAVISVIAVIIFIYQTGLRYIKSDLGIKYFGAVDKNGDITEGRLWFDYDSASIRLQKYYIFEFKNSQVAPGLIDLDVSFFQNNTENYFDDVLGFINNKLTNDLTVNYPLNNIIFNTADDRVLFWHENFDAIIKNHEDIYDNYISSGEMYLSDGDKWIMAPSTSTTPASYKDFDIVQDINKTKKYKGSIFDFINREDIFYAVFVLKDGNIINLYPAREIYRISYDKGSLKGDLYIGRINESYQKNGRGLYYHTKSGDIYYGDYVDDIKTGWSEFLSDVGDSYEGYIVEGRKDGEGIFKWSDGSSYQGTFKDNMKNGKGINIFSDGSVYEGDYADDVKQGFGKYIWAGGDVYEGEFENDLYKGLGKYNWVSGDYYEGEFNHNTLHGWGKYTWANGHSYEGWWNLGEMVEDMPEDAEAAVQ